MTTFLDYIENTLNIYDKDIYTAIIGENPSKGAKSPKLWNVAFKGLGISGIMHPMDVTLSNLEKLVVALKADKRFIGGAVTIPYKISIIPFLDNLETEAKTIGAVNCIYRKGNKLIGTNTDGAAALWSLEKSYSKSLAGSTVLLIGTGGAGLAVAVYIAHAIGKDGTLLLSNRSANSRNLLAEKLQNICKVETFGLPVTPKEVSRVDIIVNCTSIGYEKIQHDSQGNFFLDLFTPMGDINCKHMNHSNSKKTFAEVNADTAGINFTQTLHILANSNVSLIFDIVYQPKKTMLIQAAERLDIMTLSGLPMNLEQAVIAFDKTTSNAGLRIAGTEEEVRTLMQAIA